MRPARISVLLILIAPLLFVIEPGSSRAALPIVRANSPTASISIDGGPFYEGAWHLNPNTNANPDYYMIGSSLPYGTKKIVFRTDLDSIAFDVQAGNEYDFIFLLNGKQTCHTRIWARPDPAIWGFQFLIPICTGLATVAVLLALKWRTLKPKPLLACGLFAPVLFWAATVVCGSVRGNYNHIEDTISQLGEVGSKAEVLSSLLFIVVSVLCVLFSIGLYKSTRSRNLSIAPALLSLAMPVTMAWAAVFPAHNEMHGLLGPVPLLVNVGALLTFLLWKNHDDLVKVRRWSLVSLALMMLLFLVFSQIQELEGLFQRFWYCGWSIWFVSLSLGFSRTKLATSNVAAT